MWTWTFWEQTLERVIRTFLAALIAGGVGGPGFDLWTSNWGKILGASASTAFVTLIFCLLASIPGDSTNPQFIPPPVPPIQGD